jgi:hypothetical protein
LVQAAHEERCHHHENDAEGDLCHDEGLPQPKAIRRSLAFILQRRDDVRTARMQAWCEAGQ